MKQQKKTNNFDILKEMSRREKDIRMFPDVVRADLHGTQGHVTIGVNSETIMDMMANKPLHIFLIVADSDQYKEISEGKAK